MILKFLVMISIIVLVPVVGKFLIEQGLESYYVGVGAIVFFIVIINITGKKVNI